MEIAVVGATAVVTSTAIAVTDARVAITALAPTIRRVPEAEAALAGTDGGAEAIAAAAAAAASAATRSATCAAPPATDRDGRGHRPPRDRRRADAGPRRRRPHPREPRDARDPLRSAR